MLYYLDFPPSKYMYSNSRKKISQWPPQNIYNIHIKSLKIAFHFLSIFFQGLLFPRLQHLFSKLVTKIGTIEHMESLV